MHRNLEKKILINHHGQLLIDALHEATQLSKTSLKSALEKGCVWLDQGNKVQRVRRAKKPLKAGDKVFLYYNEKVLSSPCEAPELLLDKQHYSIWFKPAGVLSQGSKWGDHCALTRLSEKSLKRDSYLVHRLDRATSGVMLMAHSKKAAKQLSNLFASRQVNKTYEAIVPGEFTDTLSIQTPVDGKSAISHIKRLDYQHNQSLLSITIETGRKHQIRQHLSSVGFPIIGDRLYGSEQLDTDLTLQSVELSFVCPIEQQNILVAVEASKRLKL